MNLLLYPRGTLTSISIPISVNDCVPVQHDILFENVLIRMHVNGSAACRYVVNSPAFGNNEISMSHSNQ